MEVHAHKLGRIFSLNHQERVNAVSLVSSFSRIVNIANSPGPHLIDSLSESEIRNALSKTIKLLGWQLEIHADKLVIECALLADS